MKKLELKLIVNKPEFKKYLKPYLPPGPLFDSFQVEVVKDGLLITSDLPYAEIQNEGGNVPPFAFPRGSDKVMRFETKAGVVVFTKKRKGFHIRGKHFIEKAIKDYEQALGDSIDIEWA